MITKNEIKQIKALKLKRERESSGLFVVEGRKLVDELLKSNVLISRVYAVVEWHLPEGYDISVTRISNKELERISNLSTPDEVVAVARIPDLKTPVEDQFNGLSLYLDGIADPGNLGTIIRMADWFGLKSIYCGAGSADGYNQKTVQSSMGSVFRVRVFSVNGDAFIEKFKKENPGIPVIGAEMKGDKLSEFVFPKQAMLVMGSESHGISKSVSRFLTGSVTIPRVGAAESLNVATATGILIWEYWRANPQSGY